jgi:hypothetical protein
MTVLIQPDRRPIARADRRSPAAPPSRGRRRWVQRAAVLLLGLTVLALPLAPGAAQAAPSDGSIEGVDISYPQCGRPLPTGQAFAIVGVNGGTPARTNPCLAAELAWARRSTGQTTQDAVQLYVNTANPGGGATWPQSGSNRHGLCDGSNSRACAYQYGWERARDDATVRAISNPEQYRWWLDVETVNSWDYTSGGRTRNAAVLEGMTEYFTSIGSRGVGLYSTATQWRQIVGGGVESTSSLNGLPNWRPTGNNQAGAVVNCGLAPLTPGGTIELTQYTREFDYNHSCD